MIDFLQTRPGAALTAALVDYRVAELQLQRDLGVLQIDSQGLWHEYIPADTDDR